MNRPRLLSTVLILVVLLLTGITPILALNYSGYCVAELRFVPDEEKINNVVSVLAQGGVSRGFVEKDGKLVEASTITTLPYKNTDEFFADNPNCCQVGPVVAEGYYEPTLVRRLAGTVSDVVAVTHPKQTIDQAGVISSEKVLDQFSINNCGRIVSNVPF
jgi:hypothetical protein